MATPAVVEGTDGFFSSRSTMPVRIDVPVNHSSCKEMPDILYSRVSFKKSLDFIAEDSYRLSARSERASARASDHLKGIQAKAARAAQRVEEAAARKREQAEESVRKLEAKIEADAAKALAIRRQLAEKQEAKAAKREAAATAVQAARSAADVAVLQKGLKEATRACAAVGSRERQLEHREGAARARVQHALETGRVVKEKRAMTERSNASNAFSSPSKWAERAPASPQKQRHHQRGANGASSPTSLMADLRPFERSWFREHNAAGKLVWNYTITFDDGTTRTVRGLA